jgi:two-component system, NarL family, sensor histidine kinase DegS
MGSMRKHGFEQIGILYAMALGGIAAIIVVSQIFVQQYIRRQESDSRVINVAGRQRMLSQKISKLTLQIGATADTVSRNRLAQELQSALETWQASHERLLHGNQDFGITEANSPQVEEMFRSIIPYYTSMVSSTGQILQLLQRQPGADREALQPPIDAIMANESAFLEGMNAIVFQYDQEARDRVLKLENIEILLLILSLTIILFELLFVFRPTARKIKRTVDDLVESEQLAKDMAHEIGVLYSSLEKSYQELADIDLEVEQPTVYATADPKGNIVSVSDSFCHALECEELDAPDNLFDWLEREGYAPEFLQEIERLVAQGQVWNGEVKVTSEEGDFVWLDMNIVPVFGEEQQVQGLSVVCANKTERKEAEERSHEITREKIEKKLKEQQFRSILVLEGQEEERRRISRDIHDGIGQLLTGLKLKIEKNLKEQQFRSILVLEGQEEERRRISRDIHDGIGQLLTGLKLKIESINLVPNAPDRAQTVEEAKGLLNQLIREVRRVSFNLTPSALSDYGISAVTRKFCSEVSRLSLKKVIFENRTGFINRLDKSVETNLYRIIQEGVNNALKYAEAEEIRVIFSHNAQYLNVEICDDGAGFDFDRYLAGEGISGSGIGIHNMRERAGFINGTFEIVSARGAGTRINIHVPLNGNGRKNTSYGTYQKSDYSR